MFNKKNDKKIIDHLHYLGGNIYNTLIYNEDILKKLLYVLHADKIEDIEVMIKDDINEFKIVNRENKKRIYGMLNLYYPGLCDTYLFNIQINHMYNRELDKKINTSYTYIDAYNSINYVCNEIEFSHRCNLLFAILASRSIVESLESKTILKSLFTNKQYNYMNDLNKFQVYDTKDLNSYIEIFNILKTYLLSKLNRQLNNYKILEKKEFNMEVYLNGSVE